MIDVHNRMKTVERSSISQAQTLEQMGEFWDTHDFTDFDHPDATDVEYTVHLESDEDIIDRLLKSPRCVGNFTPISRNNCYDE